MTPDDVAPTWLQGVALIVVLAPTIAFIAFRRSIGSMNAAAGLVIWGALTACSEHGYWAMRPSIHERLLANPHSTVHYFMAGVYAAIAGVLLSVIALTLLREGRGSGWFAVLFAPSRRGEPRAGDEQSHGLPVPPHRPLRLSPGVGCRISNRLQADLRGTSINQSMKTYGVVK
jgi:hypothetical protein